MWFLNVAKTLKGNLDYFYFIGKRKVNLGINVIMFFAGNRSCDKKYIYSKVVHLSIQDCPPPPPKKKRWSLPEDMKEYYILNPSCLKRTDTCPS